MSYACIKAEGDGDVEVLCRVEHALGAQGVVHGSLGGHGELEAGVQVAQTASRGG